MSNEIRDKFSNNKETFKNYTKELTEFNKVLEDVLVITINAIYTKFMGKDINKRFANYVNDILAKKYGTFPNGNGYVSIAVMSSEWDNDKEITFDISLPKFEYRYNIKNVLNTYNKFYRDQYRQEATADNKFNEESIKALVKVININRERVARHQDAVKNFNKYVKVIDKLQKQVTETLGKINPMFYGYHIDTNAYNTPNYKEFEQKMREQGGVYVFEPQEAEA